MIKVSSICTKPTVFNDDGMWDKTLTRFQYDFDTHTLSVNQARKNPHPEYYKVLKNRNANGEIKSLVVYSPYHNKEQDIYEYLESNEILKRLCDTEYVDELEFYGVSAAMLYLANGYLGPDYYITTHASYAIRQYFEHNQHQVEYPCDSHVLFARIVSYVMDMYKRRGQEVVIYGDLDQEIENYIESHKPKSKSDVAINLAVEAIDTGMVDPEDSNWQVKVANYVKSKLWLEHDYSYEDAVKYARIAYDYVKQM